MLPMNYSSLKNAAALRNNQWEVLNHQWYENTNIYSQQKAAWPFDYFLKAFTPAFSNIGISRYCYGAFAHDLKNLEDCLHGLGIERLYRRMFNAFD